MPYIGKSPLHGNYSKLDDFSGDFDGSDATHALATNSIAVTPVTEAAVLISINGVIQEPTTDYTVSGTNITFTTAPAAGANFFGVVMGEQLAIGTPSDSTITSAKLSGNLVTPGTLDVNGQELILDANGNTSITADTDDQIDFKISGADDFQMTANTFTVLSGSTLTVASGATIANSGTATGFGGSDPDSADGDSLGTASAEWSDLYLADGGVIYFGNDQEVKITHVADTGLALKHTATADDKPITLTLQTGETDMAANDIIGAIEWQAPDEGEGTDAILVSAAIKAYAEGNHSASSNATTLGFYTGASEAAAIKMSLSSAGALDVTGDITGSTINADGDTAAGDNAAMGYTAGEGLILTGQGSTDDITIKNDADTTVVNVATGATDVEISAGNILFGTGSKGVYLGVTTATAANLLADYEEGTWTGVFRVGGTSGTDNGDNTGHYVKIGETIWIRIVCPVDSTISGTGTLKITGLPFTAGANDSSTMGFGVNDRIDSTDITCRVEANSTNIGFVLMPAASSNQAANATEGIINSGAGKYMYVNGVYSTIDG